MAIADYFARPDSEKILLAIIVHSGGTLYLSDRPYVTAPSDVPANQLFEPLIEAGGVPEFRQSIQELTGGRSTRSFGNLKLASVDHNGTDLRTLTLRNSTVELRLAAPRKLFSFADSTLWFKGIIGTSRGSTDGRVNYEITDRQKQLETITIPQSLYTAGAGVPGELVDRAKPLAFGNGRAPMFLIDSSNLVYQINDGALSTGIFEGVIAVEDDGNPLRGGGACTVTAPPTTQVVFGTWASTQNGFYDGVEFVGLTPLPSATRTVISYVGATRTATLDSNISTAFTSCSVDLFVPDSANGTVRLLVPAVGLVTAEFLSVAGTRNIPDVVEHLATTFGGMIAADVDVTTDTIAIGLWFADEVSLADIFTALARGEFSWWGFDRNDKLVMRPIGAPALPADHTIAFDDIVRDSGTWQESLDIVWRITQLNSRNWPNVGSATLAEADEVFRSREVLEDAAVKTSFDDAIERILESYSLVGTTALQRALDFFKARRFIVDVDLPLNGTVFDAGQTIDITGAPEPINSPLLITDVRGTSDAKIRIGMIG